MEFAAKVRNEAVVEIDYSKKLPELLLVSRLREVGDGLDASRKRGDSFRTNVMT